MAKSSILREYARIGAALRAQEIETELANLHRAFPGINNVRRGPGRPRAASNTDDGTTIAPETRKRQRRPMTAAEKKAVGDRMKKYWAVRRAQAAKKR